MKAMIVSDFIVMRSSLAQLAGICIVIGVVLCLAMETTVGAAAAIAAMAPFMYLFTLAAYDEQNGWERFRLTLPISRRQVVLGRYASTLAVTAIFTVIALCLAMAVSLVADLLSSTQTDGWLAPLTLSLNPPAAVAASAALASLVILLGAAVALPLIVRFGMTKATRFVPLVFVLLLAAGIGLIGECVPALDIFILLETWVDAKNWSALALSGTGAVAAVGALYATSALVAAKLYERREF